RRPGARSRRAGDRSRRGAAGRRRDAGDRRESGARGGVRARARTDSESRIANPVRIYGINPVLEALRAKRVTAVRVSPRGDERLDGAAAKASAGAVSHVKVAEVVNIARALEALKGVGVWTVGLAGDASARYDEIDFTLPTAIVVGAEGTGLRRLARERCDRLASIPMQGHVQSLNVSVAAAIALFEAVRQRRAKRVE